MIYRSKEDRHTEAISIEISFSAFEDRANIINEAIRGCRLYSSANREDVPETDNLDQSLETHVGILRALMPGEIGLISLSRARTFLKTISDEKLLERVQNRLETTLADQGVDNDTLLLTAAKPSDLSKLLAPFVRRSVTRSTAKVESFLWPVVAKVEIFLDSALLDNGIKLADVPGLSDTSTIRVSNAEKCLRACDHIIVVAPLARIADDQCISTYITKAKVWLGDADPSILVTKADILDKDETEEEANSCGLYVSVLQDIEQARTSMEEELAELTDADEQAVREGHIRACLRMLDDIQLGYLMKISAVTTAAKLQESFGSESTTGCDDLSIDFIASPPYLQQLVPYGTYRSESSAGIPELPIEYTGIPELRMRLASLGEKEKVETLSHYIRQDFPNTLVHIRGWSVVAKSNVQDGVREIVHRSQEPFHLAIQNLHDAIFEHFSTHLMDHLDKFIAAWTTKSHEQFSDATSDYVPATMSAFIRKAGCHQPKNHQQEDWNELFANIVRKDLKRPFNSILKSVSHSFNAARRRFEAICRDIIEKLKADAASTLPTIVEYVQKLELSIAKLHGRISLVERRTVKMFG